MSRWFSNVIGVFHMHINHPEGYQLPEDRDIELHVVARLAYRDHGDDPTKWNKLAESMEKRQLHCQLTNFIRHEHNESESELACDALPLFQLGASHYESYLINLRLPVTDDHSLNNDLGTVGKLEDIWVFVIHQNGGFTMVWLCLKTFFFPIVVAALIWFGLRIRRQHRQANLLERTLIAVGAALSLLNVPLEWLSLSFYMPYMMLLSDIRQGLFYSVLLSFWIIFAGEHLMDQVERNKLADYWKHLSAVAFGCICLFVFEMCERGVQLTNPFYSIWAIPTTSNMAMAFIVLAALAAVIYFCFLGYMVVRVFINISAKKANLPQMSKTRRHFYQGLIFRFRFLMAATLVSSAATVAFFILGQFSENQWKWDQQKTIEYSSAFLTGVYGMWNIYVLTLLVLYAPSEKVMASTSETDPLEDTGEEVIEFTSIPTETSALAALAQKASVD